jgi:hypothetical protein
VFPCISSIDEEIFCFTCEHGVWVLMTKFDKAGKIGLFGLPNRSIQFWQFQSQTKEGAKPEDLEIQGVLKLEKGLKCVKRPR